MNKGQPKTHTISMGTDKIEHHFRWLAEYHSISKSIFTLYLFSSTSTHWKSSRLTLVRVGCNKKMITIVVTTIFLKMSPKYFREIRYRIPQTAIPSKIKKMGSRPVRNTLKMAFEGANHLISVSLKKQSMDKKASLEAPTFCTG
jgi:hypothetical protein